MPPALILLVVVVGAVVAVTVEPLATVMVLKVEAVVPPMVCVTPLNTVAKRVELHPFALQQDCVARVLRHGASPSWCAEDVPAA